MFLFYCLWYFSISGFKIIKIMFENSFTSRNQNEMKCIDSRAVDRAQENFA